MAPTSWMAHQECNDFRSTESPCPKLTTDVASLPIPFQLNDNESFIYSQVPANFDVQQQLATLAVGCALLDVCFHPSLALPATYLCAHYLVDPKPVSLIRLVYTRSLLRLFRPALKQGLKAFRYKLTFKSTRNNFFVPRPRIRFILNS